MKEVNPNKTDRQTIEITRTLMVCDNGTWKPLNKGNIQPSGEKVWFAQSTHMSGDLMRWGVIHEDAAKKLIQDTMTLLNS